MTPEAIDPVTCERIARRWCELMGLDPVETVMQDNGWLSPRWAVIADKVPDQVAWFRSIAESAELLAGMDER